MKCVKVAVISKKNEREDDIHLRMLDLTHFVQTHGGEFDRYNDAHYTKIRAIAPDVAERTIVLPSGEYVADTFRFDEEEDRLDVMDVLDQDDQFFTEGNACRKILAERDRRDWLYIFECYR